MPRCRKNSQQMSFSSDTNEFAQASPENQTALSSLNHNLDTLSINEVSSSTSASTQTELPTAKQHPLRSSSPSARNQFIPEWKRTRDYDPLQVIKYSFISYNVLAQAHLDWNSWLYKKNQKRHLLWEYRFVKLTHFFENFPANIYCLQEVQHDHVQQYNHYFQQEQEKLCLYEKKPGDKPDGCMIAYDPVAFTLRDHFRVDLDANCPVMGASTNVGQIAVFQVNAFAQGADTEEQDRVVLIVVNTHLVYSPKNGQVKLWQICRLMDQIQVVKKMYEECQLSVVFSGDFNSVTKSGLWNLVSTGSLDISRQSRMSFSGQHHSRSFTPLADMIPDRQSIPLQSPSDLTLFEHNLNLTPAYSHADCQQHYTQTDRQGIVVDHIFHSGLRILERLSLWPLSDFTPSALPGSIYGSDHMPVGVQFEVVEEGEVD